MENASKALLIVGSTLTALILLSLFVVFLGELSKWPESENELKSTEQKAAFNAEYEVYQKSAMYGVDVISCLNKAKSNNEKYVEGGSFLGQKGYGTNYEVNVTVKINTPLVETIEVAAIQSLSGSSDGGYRESAIYDTTSHVKNKKEDTTIVLSDIFDIDEKTQLTNFKGDTKLKYSMTKESSELITDKVYSLVDLSINEKDNILMKLLEHSAQAKQVKKNREDPENYEYNKSKSSYGWSTATWTTYLYNFKQKRFKCTNLEYSGKTGLVNKIEFEEI